MKKYIKPSIEVTEVMLESPILAASNGGVSDKLGTTEIDGTSAQARPRNLCNLFFDPWLNQSRFLKSISYLPFILPSYSLYLPTLNGSMTSSMSLV